MAARKWCGDWCVGGGCGGLRVATARRFILSKIDALRSPASTAQCDATAKKGHVNYDVSDVPVKVRAAPTTGSGCHVLYWHARDDAKNSSFFGGSARRRKRDTHPADVIVGTGSVGRGLGRGGGQLPPVLPVCLAGGLTLTLVMITFSLAPREFRE